MSTKNPEIDDSSKGVVSTISTENGIKNHSGATKPAHKQIVTASANFIKKYEKNIPNTNIEMNSFKNFAD